MGSAVSAVSGAVGGILGSGIKGLTENMIPGANVADQERLNQQIASLQAQGGKFGNSYDQLQGQANSQLGTSQDLLTRAKNELGINQEHSAAIGGDALSILRNAATGGAPSAAQAQLQSGKDQAIATQMAMANSGNLSQMIGGQKTAMDNAANLTQQAANQSAQLRANEMATARQAYGTQATAFNNNLTAQNALANDQVGLSNNMYGNVAANAGNAGSLGVNANASAANAAVGGLGIQQGANNQAQQQQAQAAGGMLNGMGGAAAAMMSDADQKTNIQSDGAKAWQDIKDTFLGRYSDKKKKKNDETNKILQGHQDQDYAALVSDEDQKDNVSSDRASRAKGISSFFKNENKKDEEPKKEEPVAKKEGYSDDDPRKKRAQQIKDGFMSDENTKKDIKHGSMLHAFLDKINPVTFEYKEPTGEMGKTPGTHMGVIAQDVEKAPGGKSMVVDTPEGKTIDMASAMGMLMSAAADAHDRMSTLEELFKSRKAK